MPGKSFDPSNYPVTPSEIGLWYWHNQSKLVARWKIGEDEEIVEGKDLRDEELIRHAPCINQFNGYRYEARMKRLIASRSGYFIDFEPNSDHADTLFETKPAPKDLKSLTQYIPVEEAQNYDGTRIAVEWAVGLARHAASENKPIVIWQPPLKGEIGAFPVEKSAADMLVFWPLQGSAVRVRTIDLKSTKLALRDEKRTGQVMQTVAYAELLAPILEDIGVPHELEVGVWTREDEPEPLVDLTPSELPKTDMSLTTLARQLREDLAADGLLAEALRADSIHDLPMRTPAKMAGAPLELFTLHAWKKDSPWPTMLLSGLDNETCQRLTGDYGIRSIEDLAELLPRPETYINDRDSKPKPWHEPLPWAGTIGQKIEEDPNIGAKVRKSAFKAQILLGKIDPDHTHAYVPDYDTVFEEWAWHPGSGSAPLPSLTTQRDDGDPAMDPEAVRVYLHLGTDDLHKRPWSIAARVSRGSNPRENVATLIETATDWYSGGADDDDIEQDLLERASVGLLETIQSIAGSDDSYVHFYVYESRERDRLIEALNRHVNVTQSIDALRHLLGSEPGSDQRMVTDLESIIQQHMALPTTHTGLQNVLPYINPTANTPSNEVPKDIPEPPEWSYERNGKRIDLKTTFKRRFFEVFVPATRKGGFRPLADENDKDTDNRWIPTQDTWLTPVPRYGAQLPTEYFHIALGRFDMNGQRAPIASAAENDLLAGSLHRWKGAVREIFDINSKQNDLSAKTRRDCLPDIEMPDIQALLGGITTELNRLERSLSWGVADDFVSKQPISIDQLEQYRVDQHIAPDARVVTQNLLGAAYIEQQASLEEFRSQFAERSTREVVLDGEGIPVTVSNIENIAWTMKEGPDDKEIAVPDELRIRCGVSFSDPELDLIAPGEIARRCKYTTDDDDVGTNPIILAIPTEDDWSYPNSHRYLRHRPQLTLAELDIDDTGQGEAILEWQRMNGFAGSEPFTYGHENFDTPPSEVDRHPDAVVGAADDESRCEISVGSQFFLLKTPDNYIGKKVKNRLRGLQNASLRR